MTRRTLYAAGTILLLLAFFLSYRAWRESPTSSTKEAATSQASAKETTALDSLETKDFSSLQRDVLAILKQEYAKKPSRYDNTVLTYTEGFEEPWCADFISWVFNEAKSPFIHPETGYWRIPGVNTLISYYQQYDAYHAVGEYTPVFGDVAVYIGETPDGDSNEHVAIVLAVESDTLITIGGNESDKGILQIRHDKLAEGEKGLVGFGASHL